MAGRTGVGAGDVAPIPVAGPGNSRSRPMRRPRRSLASSVPGGAGAPPGVTRDPCQELADDLGRNTQAKSAARRRSENAAVERHEASAREGARRKAQAPQGAG